MNPLQIALLSGILVAQAISPDATDFGGRKITPDKKGEDGTIQLDPKTAKKLRELRIAEIRKKLTNISLLIESVNVRLGLMTAAQDDFDDKRALENQLRDLITLFALTEQAIKEAGRLTREVGNIHKRAKTGLRDPRRLTLANFLEARRREYIQFATR